MDTPRHAINWPTVALVTASVLLSVSGVVFFFGGDHNQIEIDTQRLDKLENVGSPALQAFRVEMDAARRDADRMQRDIERLEGRLLDLEKRGK